MSVNCDIFQLACLCFCLYKESTKETPLSLTVPLVDPRGAPGKHPSQSKFFHFHAFLGENWPK